jgi:pimeloyl-ACP methyl ester carboxylesterase
MRATHIKQSKGVSMRSRRTKFLLPLAMAGLLGLVISGLPADAAGQPKAESEKLRPASSLKLQDEFDHIGAEIHELTTNGRTSYYIDEGKEGDRAVVFIGGASTSVEAFQLTEFARTMREELGLRVISVERNGLGASKVDPTLGYSDYNNEVLAVLDHLGIDRFSILSISGGGAYGAQLAAAVPDRVISLHAAASVSSSLPTRTPPRNCDQTLEQRNAANMRWKRDPMAWWAVPGSPVLAVPGWQATAYLDGVRAFFMGGQLDDATAMSLPGILSCSPGAVVDPSRITAPTYLYWGGQDTSVPVSVMAQWQAALPNVVRATVYPDEGHTVQYRHWDQILADMAGYGDYTVACVRDKTKLVPNKQAADVIASGAALGMCAWSHAS